MYGVPLRLLGHAIRAPIPLNPLWTFSFLRTECQRKSAFSAVSWRI
jgi:hypothetical protein